MSGRPPLLAWEFFAGGGLARLGLGARWRVGFANDIDRAKAAAYAQNFGAEHLKLGDVADLAPQDLPGRADLAWASSPCQDFSLAGARGGLGAARSGALTAWLDLIGRLAAEGRAPGVLVIENVVGLATSGNGADAAAVFARLAALGYRFGATELDAAHFTPQSRPRLFVIATRGPIPAHLLGRGQDAGGAGARLDRLAAAAARAAPGTWVAYRLPPRPVRNADLADILERDGPHLPWRDDGATARLLALMGPVHAAKVAEAARRPGGAVGSVCRRTRIEDGQRRQRAEVRFDGLAACLRTPGGGSSRQFLLFAEGNERRMRPLSVRETARLMGLPESYRLPATETAALYLLGDAVVVPAVAWLTEALLTPLAEAARTALPTTRAAA